ncbi:MAG TPA: rhodanese-like domain-containing protein [Candidatus Sulfotelmatobacter sp.]|nr:rhodanese-like domain-containing protein [Candidatus Sulfotelmatobacter sp.]
MGAGQTGGAAAAYAGDVSAKEAWSKLASDSRAVLVDVRSDAEWTFVGLPDLSSLGKRPVLVPLQVFPGMKPNPNFAAEVAQTIPAKDAPVYFICRSGGRSRTAAVALTALGYSQCFNVAGGFEGDLDGERHRGQVGGWKAVGLPWVQS